MSTLTLGLAVLAGGLLGGCGKGKSAPVAEGGPARTLAPVAPEGAVSVTTRNTTRLGGEDVAADAAGIARAAYPSLTAASRPQAVVLVDERDWPAALAASALAGAPLGAPILYAEGDSLPDVTLQTLRTLAPTGASTIGGAQVIRIGTSAATPKGDVIRILPRAAPAVIGAAIARLLVSANGGKAPHQAIVVSSSAPRSLTMPAAGLAAESGAPILFVKPGRVPAPTARVLASMHHPSIYVVDPAGVGRVALDKLGRYGTVTPIAPTASEGAGAAANAVAVARFTDGTFGWGVKEPGHGLVFANAARPLDAPAAAILSATGDYGPLLLFEAATQTPSPLSGYLGNIKPAYTAAVRPVKGVYNHGWLIGDGRAISATVQAELDSLLEITEREEAPEEAPEEATEEPPVEQSTRTEPH
ncbi:MAG TPA: cell wall-binding repeat-containing protein [Solirubrobacteraceae bacterium]|nr:cell wall-binding repeat-containing protein [Solirubrobacteraceae bacterium]